MLILNPDQIKELDRLTIVNQQISETDLMERAAKNCYLSIKENIFSLINQNSIIHIFCGNGNNGGDGYVLADLFHRDGFKVKVYSVFADKPKSEASLFHFQTIVKKKIFHQEIFHQDHFPEIKENDLVIDCIFGIGLNKEPHGFSKGLIQYLNDQRSTKVSVDIPSGLFAEPNPDHFPSVIFRADFTFTFHSLKYSFLLPEFAAFVGRYFVINIGLEHSEEIINSDKRIFVQQNFASHQIKPRFKFAHKGNFGHALIVAGQLGKMGAAVLCGKACLRSGAGLVSAYIPKIGNTILQQSIPELMVLLSDDENIISGNPKINSFSVIGIGPGIGVDQSTASVLKKIIQDCKVPLVLDADALNILSENKTWLGFLPVGTILTPHPKEFDRLFGNSKSTAERHLKQKDASIRYGCIIVLKGANTCISSPDGTLFFNSTGNPGMSTAGMGDVLTGIITGLMASSYIPLTAAVLGVYIHGLSADLSLSNQSFESLISTDVIDSLGRAFHMLSESN